LILGEKGGAAGKLPFSQARAADMYLLDRLNGCFGEPDAPIEKAFDSNQIA
jgi:hypothetical protein